MANRNIERAVRVALLAAGAASMGVYASASLAQDQELEQVIVTGSRIPQPNLEGTSPISVIGAQEVALQGVTQVEDLINNLPQAFADQGGNISNGASGTATVNLRNLGADRTLVLVNGRRLPAGSPRGPVAPDINQIPAPLIERVEVLTGGASAIYGSDAVAGVVNFIMNDNFEGIQLDANISAYAHSQGSDVGDVVRASGYPVPGNRYMDGDSYEVSMLMGSNFADGRGNATLYIGYREIDALLQSERDYSACSLGSTPNGFVCLGSNTSYPPRILRNGGPGFDPTTPGQGQSNAAVTFNPDGTTRRFAPTDTFNFGPYNYYQRPDERWSVGAFAHYDVNDNAEVYGEFMMHDDRTVAQIAPSGLFGVPFTTGCDNPLLTTDWVNTLCTSQGLGPTDSRNLIIQRRNIEGGGRQDDLRHTSYRGVVGVRGDVTDNWNYDVYASYGTVIFSETYFNDFSITRGARALDVIRDSSGNAVCRSADDGTDPACVPYNIWVPGGVTPEALAYLQTPGFQRGDTEQRIVSATLSSDLGTYGVKSPWAGDAFGIAFGAEYREEALDFNTDTAFETGDLAGQGGPTIGTEGGFNVTDLFVELRAPLLSDIFLAQSLGVSASYRYSDYSTGIETNTWGVGLDWAPIDSLKFRGSYQKAVRAPNIIELYAAQALGLFDADEDPCAGATPTATLAQCANTGVTAAQYGQIDDNPAGQYNALYGGNPELDAEEADTYTVGFVFTPSFLDGFSMTVDYFNIEVNDTIGTVPPTDTLNQCLETGDSTYCSLITRDSQGTLWLLPQAQIVASNVNIGQYKTSGVDIQMDYGVDIGLGSLAFNLMGTYLDEFFTEPLPGVSEYDCVGYYGPSNCGTPVPEWRHKARITWMTPWNVDLSLAWRYIDEVEIDSLSSDEDLAGDPNEVDQVLDAQNYIDLSASWTFAEKYTIRGGVQNVMDEDPPVSSQVGAGFGNGNTFPQVYDAFGQYWFMGLTAKF